MNILVITSTFPYPPDSGTKIRSFNIIKNLAFHHNVHLASITRSSVSGEQSAHLSLFCKSIHLFNEPRTIKSKLNGIITTLSGSVPYTVAACRSEKLTDSLPQIISENKIDLIQLEELYVSVNVKKLFGKIPLILNASNCEALILKRISEIQTNPLMRKIYCWQAKKMAVYENQVAAKVNAIFCVSENEGRHFRTYNHSTYLLPNGAENANLLSALPQDNTILFTGSLHYTPNRLGLLWFFKSVYPGLLKANPGIKLNVVARTIPECLLKYASEQVSFCSDCDDISEFLKKSTLVIVPLHSGAGTRLKILEAFAAGVPVVSTTIGAEGIPANHQKELLIADTAEDFKNSILTLLEDKSLQSLLRNSASQLIKNNFLWSNLVHDVLPVYNKINQ